MDMQIFDLFKEGMSKARIAHKRFTLLVIISCVFIIIGFLFNILGFKNINYFFALLYILVFAKFWLTPTMLAVVTIFGAVIGNLGKDEIESESAIIFLKYYIAILGHILFYGAYIFLYLATKSFSENPMIFFQILAATMVMEFASISWGYGERLYKKFIKYTIPSMIIICAIGLVPDSIYQRFIGFNPNTIFQETETEKAFRRIDEIERKRVEDANVARIKKISSQIKTGEKLSPDDEDFLRQMEKERDENTLPALLKKLFSEKRQH